MKIVVIGGGGHIGTYLTPRLVKDGHEVIVITRGKTQPYTEDAAWKQVRMIKLDRTETNNFADKVAELEADVVVDLINFNLKDVKKIVDSLKGTRLSHYLYCSSIWAHGRAEVLPVDSNAPKQPLDEYGWEKYKSEQYLKEQYRLTGFPATIIMPGQISGPGWKIINPVGNTDVEVFQKIAYGEVLTLPNFGMETLHHVHPDDVAQMFVKAIEHRKEALGESFHAVSSESLTLYGYANAVYRFFGQQPQIEYLPWTEWSKMINDEALTEHSYYHLARSGQFSIENATKLLGYSPKYTVFEVVEECLKSYVSQGLIKVRA